MSSLLFICLLQNEIKKIFKLAVVCFLFVDFCPKQTVVVAQTLNQSKSKPSLHFNSHRASVERGKGCKQLLPVCRVASVKWRIYVALNSPPPPSPIFFLRACEMLRAHVRFNEACPAQITSKTCRQIKHERCLSALEASVCLPAGGQLAPPLTDTSAAEKKCVHCATSQLRKIEKKKNI